jgi:hypothetical protein
VHGQKKRRKRLLEGLINLDGTTLCWRLLSEPQWSTEHGYKGLCISVRTEDARHRELILEYPVPKKLRIPHRPKVSVNAIEAYVRQALDAGWDPTSRGKTFVHHVVRNSN